MHAQSLWETLGDMYIGNSIEEETMFAEAVGSRARIQTLALLRKRRNEDTVVFHSFCNN